jgi:kynurenine formamidase
VRIVLVLCCIGLPLAAVGGSAAPARAVAAAARNGSIVF